MEMKALSLLLLSQRASAKLCTFSARLSVAKRSDEFSLKSATRNQKQRDFQSRSNLCTFSAESFSFAFPLFFALNYRPEACSKTLALLLCAWRAKAAARLNF